MRTTLTGMSVNRHIQVISVGSVKINASSEKAESSHTKVHERMEKRGKTRKNTDRIRFDLVKWSVLDDE
jgi:hypothetical protein